ncbi:RNA 3'-terminal phosphate cyclase [Halopelagius fulvigenes]|uniref:RNA 3'-terminal phosphate cyclase n=1 Tax=Halopelagius fulvigenes TaxID=1198324 RepID=A0ABD5U6K1_9EURY
MLELDGSDGGGQLLRTALSLSAVTGRPFRMENVRAERPTPGLKTQHVAAVRAVADATHATVAGDERGSETLAFAPDGFRGGDVFAEVETAGSAALVCDAVLPIAAALDETLSLTVTGGTDVEWSPSADYLRRAKLPLLRDFGLNADAEVRRRGFYPAGGGRLAFEIRPSNLARLRLRSRGTLRRVLVNAVATESLSDADVAERLRDAAVERLTAASGPNLAAGTVESTAEYVSASSPGAIVTLVADCEGGRAGFVGLGRRGVPAESVAADAVDAFASWRESDAPVDARMGDQLAVWAALAGGEVRVPAVTDHLRTNVEVIRAFDYDVAVEPDGDGAVLLSPDL